MLTLLPLEITTLAQRARRAGADDHLLALRPRPSPAPHTPRGSVNISTSLSRTHPSDRSQSDVETTSHPASANSAAQPARPVRHAKAPLVGIVLHRAGSDCLPNAGEGAGWRVFRLLHRAAFSHGTACQVVVRFGAARRRTVRVPGAGTKTVSSPVAHRTVIMRPRTSVTTPLRVAWSTLVPTTCNLVTDFWHESLLTNTRRTPSVDQRSWICGTSTGFLMLRDGVSRLARQKPPWLSRLSD